MLKLSIAAAIGATAFGFTALNAGAAPANTAAVMAALNGHFTCKNTSGSYSSDWTPVLGGTWMRGTENGKPASEHLVNYDPRSKTFTLVEAFGNGMSDFMQGTGTMQHAVLHSVYPAGEKLTLTFEMHGKNAFTVDLKGTVAGKPFAEHDDCRK